MMCHSRYPPIVLWAGCGRNDVIPTSTARIAVPVLIESREKAEQTALSTDEPEMGCIWTDGSRDDLGNVGAAFPWKEGT
jgi:hypothetical protein